MGEKWPVSQQRPPTILLLVLPLFMLRQRTGPPSIPQTRFKGQHGPLDISCDGTPGCVMWRRWGCDFYTRKREKQTERWEVESLHLGWTGRHRSRDQHAASIYTIHALGCQVHTAPYHPRTTPPHNPSFAPHRNPFWFSIIKEGILTGSYEKMATTFGEKARRIWWDEEELYPTAHNMRHHYYL